VTGLARVQATLRPRTGFEAIDLGFQLARAWWRPLALTWLAFAVPVIAAVVYVLRERPVLAVLVLWWLRAALARIPLHVLSARLFGEDVGVAETARALPRLLRSGVLPSLFSVRLSPARTLVLPVLQLEGLRGAARRQRAALLVRQDLGAASALLATVAHVTVFLMAGLLFLAQLATPTELPEQDQPLTALLTGAASPLLLPVLYAVAMSVVEPLLVAGGFGLYLNRRVFLEGWDLEIAFRALAERIAPVRRPPRALAAALALFLLLGSARVEARICVPEQPASAHACAEAVLRNPDFGSTRTELQYLPRPLEPSQPGEIPGSQLLAWLFGLFASAAQVLLYAGVAIALIAMLVVLVRRAGKPSDELEEELPTRLLGLDLTPGSLPADVVGAARTAFAQGEWIAALSLLYRGALIHLSQRGALAVAPSATEFECLALVRSSQAEPIARAFDALTQSWLVARYGHRPPSTEQFDQLCVGYQGAFGDVA
jgi:hypothetical protein